jgi:hypothetical protein
MTPTAHHSLIWTGSYTADSGGQGEGIGAISAGPDGRLQWLGTAATADSPSFIAVHPTVPVVYAVGEQARTIQAYRRSGEFGLEPFGDPQLAGAAGLPRRSGSAGALPDRLLLGRWPGAALRTGSRRRNDRPVPRGTVG